MTCLFCNIINKKIPAKIVFESDDILAFRDISPQAPSHILIIPKKHIETLNDTHQDDALLLGTMLMVAKDIAKCEGIDSSGYRLNINTLKAGGQEVFHIHIHLLGGRQMTWPPG